MYTGQRGFSTFAGILLMLLMAVVGFAGWHVYQAREQAKTDVAIETAPSPQKQTPVQKSETTVTNGHIDYVNKTLGIHFAYPAAWGSEPKVTLTNGSLKGTHAVFTFPGNDKLRAGAMTRNYETIGKGGWCGDGLGLFPGDTSKKINDNTTYGEVTTDPDFKDSTTRVASAADMLIQEAFFAGKNKGDGGPCYGLSVKGYKDFKASSLYSGIVFLWADFSADSEPLSEFDVYKARPTTFISSAERQAFTDAVNSSSAL